MFDYQKNNSLKLLFQSARAVEYADCISAKSQNLRTASILSSSAAARTSLTLSCHPSLSSIASGRSSGQHPVSALSCCMLVRVGRLAFARPCEGVHRSTALMSSSLLLQQSRFVNSTLRSTLTWSCSTF